MQHLATLNKVNSDLGNIENEFQTITKMFHIIKDFSMEIAPEAYALFRSLAPIYHQLRVGISFVSSPFHSLRFSRVFSTPKVNAMRTCRSLRWI